MSAFFDNPAAVAASSSEYCNKSCRARRIRAHRLRPCPDDVSHFLCSAPQKRPAKKSAWSRDFLPAVAHKDLVKSSGLRRIPQTPQPAGAAAARLRSRSSNVLAPQKTVMLDGFVERYGGRLLGGVGREETDHEDTQSEGLLSKAFRMQVFTPSLLWHYLVAGLTSTVVGYDIGASSAALDNLVSLGGLPIDVSMGPLLQGWIISVVWGGNFIGTLAAYHVPNSRSLLLASGLLNVAGGLSAGLAPNLTMLIAGRLLCGVGNGFTSVGLSQYLGEIAPPSGRGGGIACLETNLIVGALAGAVMGRCLLKANGGWRVMWGMCGPLGLLAFVAMLQLPDTPRAIFLRATAAARRGDLRMEGESGGTGGGGLVEGDGEHRRTAALRLARREAEEVMCTLRTLEAPDEAVIAELDEMEEFYGSPTRNGGASSSGASARELTGEMPLAEAASGVHRKLLAQAALAILTPALTGHYAIITYGTQMFKSVGYSTSNSANLTVLFQAIKLLVTIPDFIWLDSYPRRRLMSIGLIGILGSYVVAMLALPLHIPKVAAFALLTSAAAYQSAIGPLSWIMPTEVLPTEFRARGAALTSAAYAFAGLMLVQLHPLLAKRGPVVALAVYTIGSTLALALNHWYLPETGGLSLEAIEREAFREQEEQEEQEADQPPQVTALN